MSNCIWFFIKACDGNGCNNCKYDIDSNSDAGSMIELAYSLEVDTALQPVHENWHKIFLA